MNSTDALVPARSRRMNVAAVGLGGIGILGTLAAGWAQRAVQFNVVTYSAEITGSSAYPWAKAFAILLFFLVLLGAAACGLESPGTRRWVRFLSLLAPLALNVPLASYGLRGAPPPFVLSIVWIVSMTWTAWRIGRERSFSYERWIASPYSIWVLVVLIAGAVFVHTRLQIVFFEHFMLGHADFGHYLEELKNALAGRGLRCDSFPNTRLGWHFSPTLYAMAPLYGLWPSPTLLMVCAALFLHIGALPIFFTSRRLSGSSTVALLLAVAWLLHPSLSRMVYSNTYGFQWVYTAIPLTLCAFGAIWTSRWFLFTVFVVAILLVQETTSAAVFGIGLYLFLNAKTRRKGLFVMIVSVVFLFLCVRWFIPAFAASGRYERMDLFGSLGGSFGELVSSAWRMPNEFWDRLGRSEGFYLLAILLSALVFLPLVEWRVTLAALPSLVLVFLLQNRQWLSIKFWHQATALPILFCATMKMLAYARPSLASPPIADPPLSDREIPHSRRHAALALAVMFGCAWGHYFYGFSPLSKSFEVFAADPRMMNPDPRMDAVRKLREEISRDRTILATERLAAHFTDYRRLYTGRRMRNTDFVLIDRSDRWDQTELLGRSAVFADDPNYTVYREIGPIIVFARAVGAPPFMLDD